MESRRRQTITITKANFETCERFLQFCLYINLLKPNSMQHDCLKYFRILINWFGKTYYYFSMIFKNMAIHHLVNCLFYANLRTSIWGWWVTGSGPYNILTLYCTVYITVNFNFRSNYQHRALISNQNRWNNYP